MKTVLLLILAGMLGCASSGNDSGLDAGSGGGPGSGAGGTAGAGGMAGAGGAGGVTGDPERLVFVTASTSDADLAGLLGADALCANEAADAGIEGDFKAWLSTVDTPVGRRLEQAEVPYVLVDGTRIANDWTDLTDGSLLAPINLDAAGQQRGGDVWTGTLPSGESYDVDDCDGYMSNGGGMGLCGTTQSTGAAWSASQTPSCGTPLRLFCFQQ